MADTPKIPFPGVNRNTPELELKDVLDIWKQNILLNFNCHHVGTVQSFSAGDASHAPTVQATINYKKTLYKLDPQTRQQVPTLIDYPMLIDMPIVILSGAKASLTMPIAKGDECLILFNDRDIDNWFTSGQTGALLSNRLHSFSDGIALIGVRSNLHPITSYDLTRADLRNDKAHVAVSPTKIKVYNDTRNLNTLLQSLMSKLEDLATAISAITVSPGTFNVGGSPVTGASGTPINAATINGIRTDLINIGTQIGELLE